MTHTPKIHPSDITKICYRVNEKIYQPFPGYTVVSWKLPNGFCISEDVGSLSVGEPNRFMGVEKARAKLMSRVYELEAYRIRGKNETR